MACNCKECSRFFIRNQLPNGDFGCWWSLDGRKVITDGTNGAYIIWILSELYNIIRDYEYIKAAEKAMQFYYSHFVDKDIYYGDTLDAHAIDKEGAHAIMKAALLLYENTRKNMYLKIAKRAAYFILSWMLFWNIPFDKQTFLGKLNFKSKGWTIVSVENQHLDPYGLIIAPDFIRLSKFTREKLWYETGLLMAKSVISSAIKISKYVNKFFAGYQPEQIYHTNWSYFPKLYVLMYMLLVHGMFSRRVKGCAINNIFWTTAGCLNSALDLAEELGISFSDIYINPYVSLKYKLLKTLRNIFAFANILPL